MLKVCVFLKGKELEGNDIKGALCLKYPWPGMARTIIGDHKRFIDTYFSIVSRILFHRETAGTSK